MTLDCDQFRVNFEPLKNFLSRKAPDTHLRSVTEFSVAYSVPIIVTLCYYGELYGFTEEVDAEIRRLMEFYRVTELINARR